MMVYIVTMDDRIQAVFSEREQAALYCAVRQDLDCKLRIEEWDTEAIRITSNKPLLYKWSAYIDSNKKAFSEMLLEYTFKAESGILEEDDDCYVVTFTVDKEITAEQAGEIALDRLEKWKNR